MKTKLLVALLLSAGVGTSALAGTASVAVSANITGTCVVTTAAGAMAFGALDQTVGGAVTGTPTNPVFWCTKGTAYTITDDLGLHETGTTYQMKNSANTDVIPYTLSYTASGSGTGKGTPITLTLTGGIAAGAYDNVSAGSYADTVTLTIAP